MAGGGVSPCGAGTRAWLGGCSPSLCLALGRSPCRVPQSPAAVRPLSAGATVEHGSGPTWHLVSCKLFFPSPSPDRDPPWSCGKRPGLRGRWTPRTSRWPVMRTQVRRPWAVLLSRPIPFLDPGSFHLPSLGSGSPWGRCSPSLLLSPRPGHPAPSSPATVPCF